MRLLCVMVDDDEAFLDVARALLERDGITVAGVAHSGAEAVERVQALRPDVVLIDIRWAPSRVSRWPGGWFRPLRLIRSPTETGAGVSVLVHAPTKVTTPSASYRPMTEKSTSSRGIGKVAQRGAGRTLEAVIDAVTVISGSVKGAPWSLPWQVRRPSGRDPLYPQIQL
jgi:hypothetical protein